MSRVLMPYAAGGEGARAAGGRLRRIRATGGTVGLR